MAKKECCLRLVKAVVFMLIIALIYKGLAFAFIDDVNSLARVTMHDYYELEGDVDVLFIGTSHTQRGIDANMLSEQLGVDCFNLATAAQRLSGTYYLAEDAIAKNSLTDLYVEISIPGISSENDTYSTYTLSDYMQLSWSKIRYLSSVLPEEAFTDKWIPLCRAIDITQGLDFEKTIQTVKEKCTSDMYGNYLAAPDFYEYMGRGGWRNMPGESMEDLHSAQYEDEDFFVSPERFNETQMDYLDKLINLCEKNDVDLTFMVLPFSDLYIAGVGEEYVESVAYIEQYCSERAVGFVDFNCVSKEELSLTDDCFADMDHLNAKGAEQFSAFLAQFMLEKEKISWYSTVTERIAENKGMYGVIYQRENDWESAAIYLAVTPVYEINDAVTWTAEVIDDDVEVCELDVCMEDNSFYVDVPMKYMGKTLILNALNGEGRVIFTSKILL